MKKIIVSLGIAGMLLPFGAFAATSADCIAQGRTLGSDNECHPNMADCLARPGGPNLIGFQCVLIGGGGIAGSATRTSWIGAPVHHDPVFGDLMDISGTKWYQDYLASFRDGTWAAFLAKGY